ncbi:MAG TPA: hypothetical protein PLJ60_19755 [Chryseolinea sp.]|nr:hypothetical protein [Chryseolinea sp.]HPH46198.1 hypothetical protein [Chryseolinea sp.]HPM32579.1 hypothetical protein [Chryseolinea sp.]
MQTPSTISEQDITAQLQRVLSFPAFTNSVLLSAFLKFVVDEKLAGREKELKEYTIGIKVLSKKMTYDPQTDATVRIHAGRLRRTLNEYYDGPGISDPIFISIPKGAYIPMFDYKKLNPVIPNAALETPALQHKPTIAVLPFRVLNEENVHPTFADSLGDHISTELTSFSELLVVSYFSTSKLSSEITDFKEAGRMLGAKYILTGSVQSDSTHLRIRVQLIQTESQQQIWTNSYEHEKTASSLFKIQDDVVRHVVNQIGGYYGIIFREAAKIPPAARVEDLKIYDAIFWYYHMVNNQTEEVFLKAKAAMEYSVKLDPAYALGWAILGETYVAGFFKGYQSNIDQPLENAVQCAKTSLRIDPLCQHAYQTLGLAHLFLHQREACLKVAEQWMKLKPKAAGIAGGIGFCLICAGEYERGFKLLDDSIQLNPYYQWWLNGGLSFYYFQKKEYEDALYWAEKMNMPDVPWELLMKAASLAEMNNLAEANEHIIKMKQRFPELMDSIKPYLGAFLQSEQLVDSLYSAILKTT